MHADQVDLGGDTVRRLVGEQFPDWRGLPVRYVASGGTVHALFRLGDDVVLRFPLRPSVAHRDDLLREQDHARLVAACVPVEVPEPLAIGEPGDGYPGVWAAYRWIPGDPVDTGRVEDVDQLARDLAGLVRALRTVDTGGRRWDGTGRGGPLRTRDGDVRGALAHSTHLTDTARLGEVWARCRDGTPATADVFLHADLMPGNLLVRDGRLAAVIDLETVSVGDPAVDLMPAWNLLPPEARETFRRAVDVDDATWERGRGWAIVQAAVALPYYLATNPAMAETARHTLTAVLRP